MGGGGGDGGDSSGSGVVVGVGVGVVAPQRTGQVYIYIGWWREEGEGVDVLGQRERLGEGGVSKALGGSGHRAKTGPQLSSGSDV